VQITVKLMASLRSKLPAGATGATTRMDVQSGSTIAAAMEQLGIPSAHIHLVTINGEMEPDRSRVLVEGDELVVFPPVAGG
jgi:sulfur carrier protein ThiS